LSAPVYDVHAKKFTGFLDMKDLVSFVVFIDDDQKSDVPNDLKELGLATILVLIFFSYAWNKDVQSSS
jgi:hypothetical protein